LIRYANQRPRNEVFFWSSKFILLQPASIDKQGGYLVHIPYFAIPTHL
jgi:hypothetical protein